MFCHVFLVISCTAYQAVPEQFSIPLNESPLSNYRCLDRFFWLLLWSPLHRSPNSYFGILLTIDTFIIHHSEYNLRKILSWKYTNSLDLRNFFCASFINTTFKKIIPMFPLYANFFTCAFVRSHFKHIFRKLSILQTKVIKIHLLEVFIAFSVSTTFFQNQESLNQGVLELYMANFKNL